MCLATDIRILLFDCMIIYFVGRSFPLLELLFVVWSTGITLYNMESSGQKYFCRELALLRSRVQIGDTNKIHLVKELNGTFMSNEVRI